MCNQENGKHHLLSKYWEFIFVRLIINSDLATSKSIRTHLPHSHSQVHTQAHRPTSSFDVEEEKERIRISHKLFMLMPIMFLTNSFCLYWPIKVEQNRNEQTNEPTNRPTTTSHQRKMNHETMKRQQQTHTQAHTDWTNKQCSGSLVYSDSHKRIVSSQFRAIIHLANHKKWKPCCRCRHRHFGWWRWWFLSFSFAAVHSMNAWSNNTGSNATVASHQIRWTGQTEMFVWNALAIDLTAIRTADTMNTKPHTAVQAKECLTHRRFLQNISTSRLHAFAHSPNEKHEDTECHPNKTHEIACYCYFYCRRINRVCVCVCAWAEEIIIITHWLRLESVGFCIGGYDGILFNCMSVAVVVTFFSLFLNSMSLWCFDDYYCKRYGTFGP